MSEQEKERTHAASDDPEVEAHKTKGYGDEEADREGAERRETGEESDDVEAHRFKNA